MENNETHPLVSAIMLAGKSPLKAIRRSIACFRKQTYPYKELIIVNNTTNHYDAVKLEIKAEPNVFLIDAPYGLSAGMARNYGIRTSNGQIIAQFDSDYWYNKDRLETQILSMAANSAHISVLSQTLYYSSNSFFAGYNVNERNVILNTMVFVRPNDIDYDDVNKGEEFSILKKMQASGMEIVSIDSPHLACKMYDSLKRNSQKKLLNKSLNDDHLIVINEMLIQCHNDL